MDINMTAWLGIVLYVVQDDRYKKIPLDFIRWVLPLVIQTLALMKLLRLSGGHSGQYLTEQVGQCMDEFEITKRISLKCSASSYALS
jgi:hypothetical protein